VKKTKKNEKKSKNQKIKKPKNCSKSNKFKNRPVKYPCWGINRGKKTYNLTKLSDFQLGK
jgi:hypothetical protein